MASQYATEVSGNMKVSGRLDLTDASINHNDFKTDTAIPRSKLAQDTFQPYVITPDMLRVHDDLASLLPGTAASDDLAVIEGTFGADLPTVQTSDAKATTVTQRARFLFPLPPEYDAGDMTGWCGLPRLLRQRGAAGGGGCGRDAGRPPAR